MIGQTIKCPECNGAIRLPSPAQLAKKKTFQHGRLLYFVRFLKSLLSNKVWVPTGHPNSSNRASAANGGRGSTRVAVGLPKPLVFWILGVFALFGLFPQMVVYLEDHRTPSSATKERPTTRDINDPVRITASQGIIYACISQELSERIFNYLSQADRDAWASAIALGIMNGTVEKFNPNEEVYIMGRTTFWVQIRRKGEHQAYWVRIDEIQK